MKIKLTISACFVAGSTALCMAQGVPSLAGRGALVMVITDWDVDCSGSTRDPWDNMCDAWYDEIRNSLPWPWGHGSNAWWGDGFYHNGYRVDSEFADCSDVSWGDDCGSDHADEPDALLVGMHGGEMSGDEQWYARVRYDEPGTGNCNAWQAHMEVGDYDAEFWHLSSCHSMDYDVWFGSDSWSDSMGEGVHQIDGFHHCMWIGTSLVSDYEDFADDAFSVSIRAAWMDTMYYEDISDDYQQCPVARGVGTNILDVLNRLVNEEYDYVFSDPVNPTWNGAFYIAGCAPACGSPLPG